MATAVEPHFTGPEDHAHSTVAQLGLERIPAGQRLLQRQKGVIRSPYVPRAWPNVQRSRPHRKSCIFQALWNRP
jgi:hypothetical protein